MGDFDVILRIKITRTPDGYALSQSHYIEKILKNLIRIRPMKQDFLYT